MKTSCLIKPKVKNKEGKYEDSRLFDSLLSFFDKNRNEAKKHYFIATHKDFIEAFGEDLSFDENGEVTLESYLKATQTDEGELKFLAHINKVFESGEYDIDTAISKVRTFNKGEHSKNYIPKLTLINNDKAKVEIVKRTSESEINLKNSYKQINLSKRIIKALTKAGVGVEFLEGKSGIKGRYSTENIEQAYNGLYNLITIFEGRNVSETLAEEAGHFIYAALQGNPLITRLTNALTEDVVDSYELELELYNDAERRDEIAGKLIGKALLKKQEGVLSNLLDRICTFAKRVFAKITRNELEQLRLEAEEAANLAAENFLSPNFESDIQTALKRKETLYSRESTISTKNFAELKAKLGLYKRQLQAIGYSAKKRAKNIDKTLNISTKKINSSDSIIWRDFWSTRGILESLEMLIGDYESIRERLDNIDETTKEINYRDLNTIKEGRVFVNTAHDIISFAEDYIKKIANEGTVTNEHKQIEKILKNLKELVTGFNYTDPDNTNEENNPEKSVKKYASLKKRVEELETNSYLMFLEKMYGSDYIRRVQHVVLDKFKIRKFKGPKGEKEWNQKFKDYLSNEYDSLFEEDSVLGYFFASYQNIKDPTMSTLNDMVRQARRYANQSTLIVKNKMLDLYDRLYEIQHGVKVLDAVRNPVDAGVYYETFEDGAFTGNIMQPLLYGLWEQRYDEFKKRCIEEFDDLYKGKTLTSYERGEKWSEFFGPKELEWHARNSTATTETTPSGVEVVKYLPSLGGTYEDRFGRVFVQEDYVNKKWYTELSTDERNWIESYVELKKEIDSSLGRDGHTRPYRLPQFRGDLVDRCKTALQQEENKLGGIKRSIGEVLSEQWNMVSEDTDYGSDLHYSTVEDDFLDDTGGGQYGETLKRLPLYGINKLAEYSYTIKNDRDVVLGTFNNRRSAEDYLRQNNLSFGEHRIIRNETSATHKLSRDLFHSTLLYADMAHKYEALKEVSYAASLADDIYSRRNTKYGDKQVKSSFLPDAINVKKWGALSSYGRYTAFVDKAIYGKYTHTKMGKFSVNKAMSVLSSIGSSLMLGGNLVVGFKDFAGKINGILKEAHVQEHVSQEAINKAIKWYFKHCVTHMFNFANDKAQDEISAFKEYFNVSDTFDSLAHEFKPQKSYIRKFLESCIWSPLAISSSCEVIVHAALAFDTKVQDIETRQIVSLMDIYKRDRLDPSSKRKMLTINSPALRSLENEAFDEFMLYSSLLVKLETFISKSKEERDEEVFEASLTDEEKALIYNYSEKTRETPEKLLTALYDDRSSLTVNTLYENAVVESKARVILNNIAGIYNFLDRSAFQDTFLGVAALNMKGWFNGMVVQAGLNSSRYSPVLKSEQEGFFTSNLKFIVDLCTPRSKNEEATKMSILIRALFSTVPGFHYFFGREKCKQDLIDAGYTKNQYNNIVRWVDSMFSIALLQCLSMMFKMLALKAVGGGDEEEEENITKEDRNWYRFWGILHYLTKAARNEFLGVFWPPLAWKQAMNFTSVNAFTPIAGLMKLGELMGLSAFELSEWINNWSNPEDEVWKEIHKGESTIFGERYVDYQNYNIDTNDPIWEETYNSEGKHTGYRMVPDGTWKWLLRKDKKTKELKYRNLQVPKRDKDGNIEIDPITGEVIYETYTHNGYTIKVPIYKSEYAQAVSASGVRGGDSRRKEKLEKITPVRRHKDILRDPIAAAENLQVVWDKKKR